MAQPVFVAANCRKKRKFWYYNNHLLINNKAKGASLVTCTAQTLKTFEFEQNLQV